MTEQRSSESHTNPGIVGLGTFPGMNPEIIDACTKNAKVLVLTANAGGGFSSTLLPSLENLIQEGVAVFALPEHNPDFPEAEKGKGVVHFNGQPQVDAQTIGVTYLERAGTLDLPEVYEAISKAMEEGYEGSALADYIQAQFAYPQEDRPPEPDAVIHMQALDERLKAEGLGGVLRDKPEDVSDN